MRAEGHPEAAGWFARAARHYVEQHQACPWCGQRHCVFRTVRPDREQFACSECDFFACRIAADGRFLTTPGNAVLAG